ENLTLIEMKKEWQTYIMKYEESWDSLTTSVIMKTVNYLEKKQIFHCSSLRSDYLAH
ncbi:hypothetical protein HispidOSU_024198, partial [Sigmodon hispidus]